MISFGKIGTVCQDRISKEFRRFLTVGNQSFFVRKFEFQFGFKEVLNILFNSLTIFLTTNYTNQKIIGISHIFKPFVSISSKLGICNLVLSITLSCSTAFLRSLLAVTVLSFCIATFFWKSRLLCPSKGLRVAVTPTSNLWMYSHHELLKSV